MITTKKKLRSYISNMKNIDVIKVKVLAKENFLSGFNCAQSVALSFIDYLSISKEDLLKMSSPFGGGVSRLREMCGALNGAIIVYGLMFGYSIPETGDIKAKFYKEIQELTDLFKEKHGSYLCRELLNVEGREDPTPSIRDENFYKTRPCLKLIESMAEILANYINEKL